MVEAREGLVRRMCAYSKVLSEPVRMKMIKVLGSAPDETLSVGEVAEALHISQPVASKHLQVLYNAGIADRQRDGMRVLYVLNEDSLAVYRKVVEDSFAHKNTPCINEFDCDSCPKKETCA